MTTPQRPTGSTPAMLLDELASPQGLSPTTTAGIPGGTGSTGTRYDRSPINVQVLQHVTKADQDVAEFIERARRATGAADAPLPADRTAVYRAAAAAAAEVGGDWPRYLAAMEWRTKVESELLLGDAGSIRREPCPECRTYGLIWVRAMHRVSCLNRHCAATTETGERRTFTVQQLANARTSARRLRVAS
ncbi:hypothetical protein ABTX81_30330 [Kitasatospora sp. NPDC097605]|uniref:hypothetical protein n=1 Tax=Kitasatospora sp. NPDC097605 TaxID=3157226 RepID=UPI003321CFEC